MPGAAGIFGAAMTGNYAAIGLSLFTTAIQGAEKGVKSFGEAAASIAGGDAQGLARAFTGLTGQIPIVGGIIGGLGNAVLDVSDALMAQGRRLSQYNATLAIEFARFDVQNIMRDIRRSQDPAVLEGVRASMEARNRLQDTIDKYKPAIVKFATVGLSVLETLMTAVEEGFYAVSEMIRGMIRISTLGRVDIGSMREMVARMLNRMEREDLENTDIFFNDVFGGIPVLDERNPNFGQAAGRVDFPGLGGL
jgi:hypothetical protein